MALQSMTGFGRGSAHANGWRVDVELGSVNRRQFDGALALPREFGVLEPRALALMHARIRRGYVKGTVRLHSAGRTPAALDVEAARAQIAALRAAAGALGLADNLAAADLLRLPQGPLTAEIPELDSAAFWALLEPALRAALDALCAMRAAEGAALESDLRAGLGRLAGALSALRDRAPGVTESYRTALRRRLAEAGVPLPADDPALLRELALFADRGDISEELVRIASHFTQVAELLRATAPCGRTLDFLCQELFREINTIGSKANDVAIAALVVGFKADLEAFREQVQNVE